MFKRNIPNAITCGNLLCGCLATVKCFEGNLVLAAYLVGIAAVLDFLDGFAARILKVSSPIGKDLDSLADMVTFGLVPGVMMYKMCVLCQTGVLNLNVVPNRNQLADLICFIISVFSAIRLAKFNHDTRQTESFIGLPTPANAILICSLPLIFEFNKSATFLSFIYNPAALYIISCLLSFLLLAPLPLFALKFKNFKWQGNQIRYLFLIWSLLLLVLLQFMGIPLIIVSYILFSVGNNLINRKKKTVS